jgi:hypothetical protein
VGAVDNLDVVGGLALGALDLLVAGVAHEDDVVVLVREAHRLLVHLGHQRAGCVNRVQPALGGLGVDGRGDAVGGEDDAGAHRHLVGLGDEDGAALGEGLHDVLVVDDLLAHVDRRPVVVQGLLDGVDGAVHAGAVAARGGHEDPFAALGRGGRGVGVLTGELDGRHGHHCATVGLRSPVVDVAQWCM